MNKDALSGRQIIAARAVLVSAAVGLIIASWGLLRASTGQGTGAQTWTTSIDFRFQAWEMLVLILALVAALNARSIVSASADFPSHPARNRGLLFKTVLALIPASALVWLGLSRANLVGATAGVQAGLWALCLLLACLVFPRGRRTPSPDGEEEGWLRFTLLAVAMCVVHILAWSGRLGSWRLAWHGDEYGFYDGSLQAFRATGTNIFSTDGTYSFPRLSNIAIGTVIELFGGSVEAFRLSGLLPVTASIPAVMLIARELVPSRYAWLSGLFLALDPLSSSIGIIGYSNTQILPVVVWSCALAALALKRESPLLACMSGSVAGCGFYVPYIGLMAVGVSLPLLILLILLRGRSFRPPAAELLAMLLAFGFGFLAVSGPRLVDFESQLKDIMWRARPEVDGNALGNVFNVMLAPLFFDAGSHQLKGAVFLPVVGMLFGIGLFVSLMKISKPGFLFVTLNFVAAVAVSGPLAPYRYPSVTRILAISPWVAILAAIGSAALCSAATVVFRRSRYAAWTTAMLLALLVLQSAWAEMSRLCDEGSYPGIAHMLRVAMKGSSGQVRVAYPPDANLAPPRFVFAAYGLGDRAEVFSGSELLKEADSLSLEPEDLVIIQADVPERESIHVALEKRCASLACSGLHVRSLTGGERDFDVMFFRDVPDSEWAAIASQRCPRPFSAM
jgi:hypothetical protein